MANKTVDAWVEQKKFGSLRSTPADAAAAVAALFEDPAALEVASAAALASAKPDATDRIARDLWALVHPSEG